MGKIIKDHPTGVHPFSVSLLSTNNVTKSGVDHRELEESGQNDVLLEHMELALRKHHIEPEALKRHKALINSLRIANLPMIRLPAKSYDAKGEFRRDILSGIFDFYDRNTTAYLST
mgnify:CR=1 FL=1